MSETPISIVIPAFNQLEYCRRCIDSLVRHTRRAYRLILVDNGSTDGVTEFFDAVPGAMVVHTGENLGFPGGANQGLARAEGHAVVLNSDTLVPEGWLTRLEAALVSAGDFGMVGPVSNYAPGEQQIRGLELRDEGDIEAFAGTLAEEKRGNVREAFRLSGFCLLIRHAALAKVGLFDERYGIGNFEDDDYCCRMRQAGYRLGIAEDCFVFHFGGRTFEGAGLSGDRFQALLAENRQRYISKWGVHLPGAASAEHQSLALNTRAQEAIAQGNPKEAVQLLHEAITIDPGLALNFAILGQVFSATGKQETAYDCFVRALRIDSSDEVTRRSFREVGDELGRREEVARLLAELNREGEGATDA